MTPERERLLAELLTEVAEEGSGWIPEAAYRPFHKLVKWAAVEAFITRNEGREVLLRYRDDDVFTGWHIIGGYMKPDEDFPEALQRNVLEDANIHSIGPIELIGVQAWKNHPFSFPVSVLFVFETAQEVEEREDLRWFPVDAGPEDNTFIIWNHALYFRLYRIWLADYRRAMIVPTLN